MKRGIWSAVLAALAVLALSSVALGHSGTAFKTKLTVRATSIGFSGKVKSPKRSCRKHRLIIGDFTPLGGLPTHLGPVRSNGKGNWTVPFTGISGAYRSHFTVSATRKCKGALTSLAHH
jgi:hypothetical protein